MVITEEDVSAWRSNPVTKALKAMLENDRQGILEVWAAGGYDERMEPVMRGKAEAITDMLCAFDSMWRYLCETRTQEAGRDEY